MKDGKLIYSLHIHVDLFTIWFHHIRPCCKNMRQVAKFGTYEPNVSNFCNLELAHRNLLVTNIIQLIIFL